MPIIEHTKYFLMRQLQAFYFYEILFVYSCLPVLLTIASMLHFQILSVLGSLDAEMFLAASLTF